MPSPFLGMDPYLEDPKLWPDFHRQLVSCLYQILLPGLVDRYRAKCGWRLYPGEQAEQREQYLEVHERDGRLVTLVDVVSPANKTTSAGRAAYLDQRRAAKLSGANIVEIDLLLKGPPMLDYARDNMPEWDYAVTVTRATQPERYEVYTSTLQKRLPRFRLPSAGDDRDTVLDLQVAFSRSYDQGKFNERVDYCRDPVVPLTGEDWIWLDGFLQEHRLRGPVLQEEVARLAYSYWEYEGRPHGKDREHWERALAELRRSSISGLSLAPV